MNAILKPDNADRKQKNVFSMVKPSESSRTLEQLADDIFLLVERFQENDQVSSMTSYQLLARVLREQCLLNPTADSDQPPVMTVRANKEISSSSLQNPSDPDAGYDAHKGKGYQVQLAETYSTAAEEDGKRPLALITYAEAEPAHHSDAKALKASCSLWQSSLSWQPQLQTGEIAGHAGCGAGDLGRPEFQKELMAERGGMKRNQPCRKNRKGSRLNGFSDEVDEDPRMKHLSCHQASCATAAIQPGPDVIPHAVQPLYPRACSMAPPQVGLQCALYPAGHDTTLWPVT